MVDEYRETQPERCRGAPHRRTHRHGFSGLGQGDFRARYREIHAGSVNFTVVCAGAAVNPGDVIVADGDGVVVPRERAAEVAQSGWERVNKENAARARLRKGELGIDFCGLREKLKQLGVEYIEEASVNAGGPCG